MFYKHHPAPGATPGSLTPPADSPRTRINVIDYSLERCDEFEISDVRELERFLRSPNPTWIEVEGLADTELIARIGELFDIHPLALEDAVNVPVRPKSEVYEGNHLVVTRMARLVEAEMVLEQATFFIGHNYLLSVHEQYGDVFDPVRRRIRIPGRIRSGGPDYLAYALIDAVIDGFYPVLDALGERLEELEQAILLKPTQRMMGEIYRVRRDLVALRRAAWPQRDAVTELLRDESPFVSEQVRLFMRDCYEHVVQISEVIDSYRDLCGSMMDLYMSTVSNRMNQVMQLLTVMTSVFIPLTFIAGVYGMNFEFMPELRYRWGYPLALAIMLAIGAGMLEFFRRRGWLSRAGPLER